MSQSVLLVDDDPVFRDDAPDAFATFDVHAMATSQHEAMELASSEFVPPAALIDLRMPDFDGIVVATELIRTHPDLVLFFFSGEVGADAFRQRARDLGLDVAGWFEKPLPPGEERAEQFFTELKNTIAMKRFETLAARWKRDTALVSSTTRASTHPAYQAIIGMGEDALPLILKELRRSPDRWFWALKAITGLDPVSKEEKGDLSAMTASWLRWAERAGL